MQDYRININYAKALFLLASERGEQEIVADDMRRVHDVCAENRELQAIFRNPEVKATKKVAIVNDLFGEHVCRTTLAFLDFVVRKKRSVNMIGISASYLDLYRESRGIVQAMLTTATEAGEEICREATKTIAAYTNKEVELLTRTSPKILGGMALEFDNKMYDARLSSRLTKLRMEFDKNVYESKL